MKNLKVIVVALTLLVTASSAHSLTVPWEHQSGTRQSGQFGWHYAYDIAFIDDAIQVDVDVQLTGYTPAADLMARWETGIESIWSTNRFAVPILFNVDWVTEAWDYSVRVSDDAGRWYMDSWHTQTASGWGNSFQEEVTAHEFGHMIALWDEYQGGAIDPVTRLVGTGGIMHTLAGGALDGYYNQFLGWYTDHLNDGGEEEPIPTPEPSSIVLFAAGLFAVAVRMKRIA